MTTRPLLPPLLLAALAACVATDEPPALGAADQDVTMWRGDIKTLVLIAEFAQNEAPAPQVARAAEQIKGLDTFIRTNSYDRAWLDYTVMGPYLLSPTGCHTNGWDGYNDAKTLRETALLIDPQIDFSQYDLIIMLSKDESLCPPGNSGYVPGGTLQQQVPTAEPITGGVVRMALSSPPAGDTSLQMVYAHEFGHVMGAGHFDALRCTLPDGTPTTMVHTSAQGACVDRPSYTDLVAIDPMGGRYAHFMAANKQLFGWLDPADIASTRDGTYTLTPLSTAGGLKMIEVPLVNSTHHSYVLEYRQPTGYDAAAYSEGPTLSGVFMYVRPPASNGIWTPTALDLPPYETGQIQATALPLAWQLPDGSYAPSYIDSAQGIAIFVYSMSPTGAVVGVKSMRNWARSSYGGTISASSTSTQSGTGRGYANDGVRVAHSWGGWWQAATTANVGGGCYSPAAWIYAGFSTNRTIQEVDVIGLQDSYTGEFEPFPGMITSFYGLRHYHVQYLSVTGAWTDVPNGYVTWNNQVWNQLTFAPINTRYIRVLIECVMGNRARLVELEAHGW